VAGNGSRPHGRGSRTRIVRAEGVVILEALGNLGDFIGGIGVVATLIYLAIQIRQNTTAVRTASRQAIVDGMRDHNRLSLEPGADSFLRSVDEFPNVSPDEHRYYTTRMTDLLLFFQGAHALHEAGTLEDETYEPYLDFVAASLATPGGARFWLQIKAIWTPRMVAALDARLERGALRDLRQLRSTGEPPAD
jgi:hypothetical protein